VIDDGSPGRTAKRVFEEQRSLYPQFRFVTRANVGLAATRNWALGQAQGDYFLPVDADNIARPDMVERFATALHENPQLSAISCYMLGFQSPDDIARNNFSFAFQPTGGPHVVGCLMNIYGDANAIFRAVDLRAVGGYDTDPAIGAVGSEDWALFVKLLRGGFKLDVLPDYLYFYRVRADSMSRTNDVFSNHQRVLRRFVETDMLNARDRTEMWTLLLSLHMRLECLRDDNTRLQSRLMTLPHRLIDKANRRLQRAPTLYSAAKGCAQAGLWLWRHRRRLGGIRHN
jgi:glycosyltransferase involved in cell wall biosynthesis